MMTQRTQRTVSERLYSTHLATFADRDCRVDEAKMGSDAHHLMLHTRFAHLVVHDLSRVELH